MAVRRRFPYEFWYAVHLLTYAAVLTSIPHQFSVGGLFAEGTWQRWYWLAICIATGAALLHYRVLEPLVATFRHQLTVSRVVAGAPGVVSIELTGRHLDELAGSGGRFFIWRFLAPGMWWHPHPFSLSAEPVLFDSSGRGTLRITVRNLGRGSAQLARLKPGTRVAIEGPYGLFSTAARSRNRVVMIGAGIGITPLRALLESTPFEPGNATVHPPRPQRGGALPGRRNPGTLPPPRRHPVPPHRPPDRRRHGAGCRNRPSVPDTGWPATPRTSPTPTSTSAARPPGHAA